MSWAMTAGSAANTAPAPRPLTGFPGSSPMASAKAEKKELRCRSSVKSLRTALKRLRSPHPPIARIDVDHIRVAVAAGAEHISAAVAVARPHPMEAVGAHDSG